MIRMIKDEDCFTCWWWYNWYITHSSCTFETEPVDQSVFMDRIHQVRKKYPWIVLQEDDKLLGYAYLSSFHERKAYEWTCDLSIYMNPDERGHGYGHKLMDAIIELARKDGYMNCVSIITGGNTASEKLHEKCGFVKKATFENFGYKNGEWRDVSYYVLKLNEPVDKPEPPKNLDPFSVVKPHRVPVL